MTTKHKTGFLFFIFKARWQKILLITQHQVQAQQHINNRINLATQKIAPQAAYLQNHLKVALGEAYIQGITEKGI